MGHWLMTPQNIYSVELLSVISDYAGIAILLRFVLKHLTPLIKINH